MPGLRALTKRKLPRSKPTGYPSAKLRRWASGLRRHPFRPGEERRRTQRIQVQLGVTTLGVALWPPIAAIPLSSILVSIEQGLDLKGMVKQRLADRPGNGFPRRARLQERRISVFRRRLQFRISRLF
jgi:hypothetical protein